LAAANTFIQIAARPAILQERGCWLWPKQFTTVEKLAQQEKLWLRRAQVSRRRAELARRWLITKISVIKHCVWNGPVGCGRGCYQIMNAILVNCNMVAEKKL